jgi:hypothetical protein
MNRPGRGILTALLALACAPALFAGELERLHVSAEDLSLKLPLGTGAFAAPAFTAARILDPDGDLEIGQPAEGAPPVDGELEDDLEAEPSEGVAPYDSSRDTGGLGTVGMESVIVQVGEVPQDLFEKARAYFNANLDRIGNRRHIGIIDFSRHSSRPRFFIIDVSSGLTRALHVAHGRGSDPDNDGYATRFSNKSDSHASSLGFYLTGETYIGKHGKSMRLHGLSPTNSNALSRAVVIHEAAYVREANMKAGRSFGCPAVAASEIAGVISSLGGGALIYAGLAGR